jgi:hypothetical protein
MQQRKIGEKRKKVKVGSKLVSLTKSITTYATKPPYTTPLWKYIWKKCYNSTHLKFGIGGVFG